MTLEITWDPLVASSEADLCNAVKSLSRYWRRRYREGDLQTAPGILPILSMQKAKGGRPRGGPAADAMAKECARLKDEEGFTYKKIAERMGYAVQESAYGKPSYSSTAKRMVIRGRNLRMQVMEMGQ